MTSPGPATGEWRSRWLPTTVAVLFALVLSVDVAIILLYGNVRNLVEEDAVEAVFTPAAATDGSLSAAGVAVAAGSPALDVDARVMAEVSESGFVLSRPGELRIRFRSLDAGGLVVIDYDFAARRPGARCEVTLARVPSRYGVDVISRRTLAGGTRVRGAYRHSLADHAGWFEVSFRVNRAAVEGGFRVGRPRIERS